MEMLAAAGLAVQKGDTPYFTELPSSELHSVASAVNEEGQTLLHIAAAGGSLALVQLLAEGGNNAHINTADAQGSTPLMCAAGCGHEAITEYLLRAGAVPTTVDHTGQTALHHGASRGDWPQVIQLLLQHGAVIDAQDLLGRTPLHAAAAAGRTEAVKELVHNASSAVDVCDSAGATPLFLAAERGHANAAMYLAGHGANVKAAANDGRTPMSVCPSEALQAALSRARRGGSMDDVVQSYMQHEPNACCIIG